MHEYAAKLHLERPTYNTLQKKGLQPIFISSLDFNGKSYTNDAAQNETNAKQLAACAAIISILNIFYCVYFTI